MWRIVLVCCVLLPYLVGCGADRGDRPSVVAAGGKVLLDGQPLADAHVVFVPPTNDRPAASARTNADGVFELTTFAPHDGAVPGDFTVTVTKRVVEQSLTTEEANAYFARTGNSPPLPTFTDVVPQRYADPTSSGLAASVRAEGENQFELKLAR